MPDTGFMSPDNIVGQSGTFFGSEWITPSTGVIVFFAGASNFQTVDGFENDGTLPGGATVVGAEGQLLATYSSSITSGNLGTSSASGGTGGAGADHLVPTSGGATQLWGLDWSSFSDLSQLQVKGSNGTANIVSQHVQLKLYYEVGTGPVRVAGTLKISSGKFTIKS